MASVVTAAPTDRAPPKASHKLDKHFGANYALGRNRQVAQSRQALHRRRARRWRHVAARAEIYRLLARQLAKGADVIMISSYLPAVSEIADVLLVFRAGGLVARHGHKDATPGKEPH
jgi:hypothetical protein